MSDGRATFDGAPARVVLRPLANPLPLGFLALAAATLLVSGLQLGWLTPTQGRDVAWLLLAFVFPAQLLASALGFLARDGVCATGMGILAGTWLGVALVLLDAPAASTSDALGLYLLLAAAAMLVPAAAAWLGKLIPAAVLSITALRFLVTGIYELTGSGTWQDIAGIVGLLLCALALYAALALELEDARRGTVLPLVRRGQGRIALEGPLPRQVAGLEHEPGVRRML